MDEKQSYQDLIVWQRAIAMVPEIYRLLSTFPKAETYALADQLRRAVVSVPANIAEGQARIHRKEFLQHLSIAKGSLAEVHTLLIVAQRLGYLKPEQLVQAEGMLSDIRRPLVGLKSSVS